MTPRVKPAGANHGYAISSLYANVLNAICDAGHVTVLPSKSVVYALG